MFRIVGERLLLFFVGLGGHKEIMVYVPKKKTERER